MLWLILLLAQAPPNQAARAREQIRASIAAQRESVRKQTDIARGIVSRAAPRPAPMLVSRPSQAPGTVVSSWQPPPCDPLPIQEIASMADAAAHEQNIDPSLIKEVARQESGFRPCAVSTKGATGLMQLMPVTQADLGVRDPWDARQSIDAGSRLLRQLLDRYHGDLSLALSAYNAGAGLVDRSNGIPAIPETQNYVENILYRLLLPGAAAGFPPAPLWGVIGDEP